jgi:hypothetical protein
MKQEIAHVLVLGQGKEFDAGNARSLATGVSAVVIPLKLDTSVLTDQVSGYDAVIHAICNLKTIKSRGRQIVSPVDLTTDIWGEFEMPPGGAFLREGGWDETGHDQHRNNHYYFHDPSLLTATHVRGLRTSRKLSRLPALRTLRIVTVRKADGGNMRRREGGFAIPHWRR